MRNAALLVLAAAALVSIAATSAAAQQPRTNGSFPDFPYLLDHEEPERAKWQSLGQMIWEVLKQIDFDFVDSTNRVVPPGMPGSKPLTGVACGRVARLWIRLPFHDCGTYNINKKTGGCNGSLRKELPETMPLQDITGNVLFKDVFDQLGDDKAKADFAFDPTRKENTGFAVSVSFFYQMKFKAQKELGLAASWADVMTYSGMLSVFMCGGPAIKFVPGRSDSSMADASGLLPAPDESLESILGAFRRMGLGSLDAVANLASHTTACFTAGCLDSTPFIFDNKWAYELLNTVIPSSAICHLPGTFPADAMQRCFAPMDMKLITTRETFNQLYLLSQNIPNAAQLTAVVAQFAGLEGYANGILWGVNLCGPGDCDATQWSFHHMFASSYYRLTSLGLPRSWRGYLPSYTGAGIWSTTSSSASLDFSVLPESVTAGSQDAEADVTNAVSGVRSVDAAAAADAVRAVAEETMQERAARETAWNATYTFKI